MVRQEVHSLGIGTGNAGASRTGPCPIYPIALLPAGPISTYCVGSYCTGSNLSMQPLRLLFLQYSWLARSFQRDHALFTGLLIGECIFIHQNVTPAIHHCGVGGSLVPRPTTFFCSSVCVESGAASVYYCQRKPNNRKNGLGLGTPGDLTNTVIISLYTRLSSIGLLITSLVPRPPPRLYLAAVEKSQEIKSGRRPGNEATHYKVKLQPTPNSSHSCTHLCCD